MAENNENNVYDPQKRERERTFVSDIYSSKQYLRIAETIASDEILKQSKGVGIIKQILLRSNSTAYSIQVIVDNETIWDNTYAFFLANTADIVGVSAYAAGGRDFLTLQDLYFQKDFQIRIRPTTSILWDVILIRYDIRDEIMLKEL